VGRRGHGASRIPAADPCNMLQLLLLTMLTRRRLLLLLLLMMMMVMVVTMMMMLARGAALLLCAACRVYCPCTSGCGLAYISFGALSDRTLCE